MHDSMIDFRGIETFYWVVTLGSFGRAAQRLSTTQPAVSQRIAALESELGERLVTRGPRQVVATPSGRELLVYAEKLLSIRAELLQRFADRERVRGILRLGVAETIVHTWLPTFIKAVNKTYPKLAVEIEVDVSPSLRQRVLAQEIDLAFLIGPLTATTVRNMNLSTFRLGFFASPSLRLGRKAQLAQIAEHPVITFSRGTQPYENLRELFQSPALPPVTLNASASLATVVRLAVEGLGVAVIPPAIIADQLARGSLVEIEVDVTLPPLSFTASWLATPDSASTRSVAALAAEVATSDEGAKAARPAARKPAGRKP